MTVYESIVIVRASLTDEANALVLEKMKAVVEQHGAIVLKAENWGKKKLAYEMKHDRRGTYMLLQFESGQGNVVSELERLCRLEDSVLKFLTVKVDKGLQAVASGDVPSETGEAECEAKAGSADGGI